MNAVTYHQAFVQAIGGIAAITRSEIAFHEIDDNECYVKASLVFATGHVLHVAEYVVLNGDEVVRLKYRYQLLDAQAKHIARWDNAPHHSGLEDFPHHFYDALGNVQSARKLTPLDAVVLSLGLIEDAGTRE